MKTYRPSIIPDEAQAFKDGVRREFDSVRQAAFRAEPYLLLQVLHAEPKTILPGMLVIADGTDWDPDSGGSGEGLYRRTEANDAWVFIG